MSRVGMWRGSIMRMCLGRCDEGEEWKRGGEEKSDLWKYLYTYLILINAIIQRHS